MKTTTLYLALCSLLSFSNVQASTAITTCKKLFDEANYEQALKPCLKAGRSGHLDSQSILGEIYDRKSDAKETYYWWNRAAMAGYIPARNQLAMKFYYGGSIFGPEKGWEQDYKTAYTIWLQDARQGNAPAQFMVAEMHHQGQGVSKDYVEAWAWFSLALENGYKLASDSLHELSNKISPEEKKQAERKRDVYRHKITKNIKK